MAIFLDCRQAVAKFLEPDGVAGSCKVLLVRRLSCRKMHTQQNKAFLPTPDALKPCIYRALGIYQIYRNYNKYYIYSNLSKYLILSVFNNLTSRNSLQEYLELLWLHFLQSQNSSSNDVAAGHL